MHMSLVFILFWLYDAYMLGLKGSVYSDFDLSSVSNLRSTTVS